MILTTITAPSKPSSTAPDVVAMLKRLSLAAGGCPYVFLTLARLRAIDERIRAGEWGPKAELVNNLAKTFQAIQRGARGRLAAERGVVLEKVPWAMASIHDLRRTYATEMATQVDLLTLCRWLGHADPKTTREFYHRVKAETVAKGRRAMADLYQSAESCTVFARSASDGQNLAATGTENGVPDTMNAVCGCSSIG